MAMTKEQAEMLEEAEKSLKKAEAALQQLWDHGVRGSVAFMLNHTRYALADVPHVKSEAAGLRSQG